MLGCLTSTFHSQSFTLSQQFDPARTLWLCFAPLPSVGFLPSELSPLGQPYSLSGTSTHVSFKLALVTNWGYQIQKPTPLPQLTTLIHSEFTASLELPTSKSYSNRVSVLVCDVLPPQSSRCSLGLRPLRGSFAHSLGLHPPLMCLRRTSHSEKV